MEGGREGRRERGMEGQREGGRGEEGERVREWKGGSAVIAVNSAIQIYM